MTLQIGIVGLPNVGKSTLFNALTKSGVAAQNFPFCTIEPNVGCVPVPDERLARLAAVSESANIIPATVEFVDIAGLVSGAHTGEGLGNQFLANIREVDAIAEVVRVFAGDVVHVSGKIDPTSDVETIAIELAMADLATVRKRKEKTEGKARTGDVDARRELDILSGWEAHLNDGRPLHEFPRGTNTETLARELALLTAKPILYVLNTDERDALDVPEGQWRERFPFLGSHPFVVLSAKIEAELAELPDTDADALRHDLGMNERGLDRLIRAAYDLLGLVTYFTSGPKETRAWTIERGTKAPKAAAVIHTDFEAGFIRAEVIDWKDFIEHGEVRCKERGKMRLEGKEYDVRDGDVITFRVAT